MANIQKYTRSAIGHLFAHFSRAKDESGQYIKFNNQKIDVTKTCNNFNLVTHNLTQLEFFNKRIKQVYCLNRKDVNVICSCTVTRPADLDKQISDREFFKHVYNFLSTRYGESNVISAYVHLDETSPHLHFCFIPVIFDSKKQCYKVSAKQVINRKDLQTLHNDLQNYLTAQLHTTVNILNDATKQSNKSIKQLKHISQLDKEIKEKETYLNTLTDKIKYLSDVIAKQAKVKTHLFSKKDKEVVTFHKSNADILFKTNAEMYNKLKIYNQQNENYFVKDKELQQREKESNERFKRVLKEEHELERKKQNLDNEVQRQVNNYKKQIDIVINQQIEQSLSDSNIDKDIFYKFLQDQQLLQQFNNYKKTLTRKIKKNISMDFTDDFEL